jgi:hypothetical protein
MGCMIPELCRTHGGVCPSGLPPARSAQSQAVETLNREIGDQRGLQETLQHEQSDKCTKTMAIDWSLLLGRSGDY